MSIKRKLVVIPGIILAFILYSLSQGINNVIGMELLGYNKSPISDTMQPHIPQSCHYHNALKLYSLGFGSCLIENPPCQQ